MNTPISLQSFILPQINQLRVDILSGIHTYGVFQHKQYGSIYAYETDGFSPPLLIDDANIPSLLSAVYLGFKTPNDPDDHLIHSTRQFILSNDNPFFRRSSFAHGIGSQHTPDDHIWPMSIIMEGLTNDSQENLDSVWKRLEISHAGTFAMHESFQVNDPRHFTRAW